jgi:hypothetical protein
VDQRLIAAYLVLPPEAAAPGNTGGGISAVICEGAKLGQNNGPRWCRVVTKILDHGTANPIVARLTVQIFAILDHCEIAPDGRDGIKVIYMNCLAKKLLRCCEIVER